MFALAFAVMTTYQLPLLFALTCQLGGHLVLASRGDKRECHLDVAESWSKNDAIINKDMLVTRDPCEIGKNGNSTYIKITRFEPYASANREHCLKGVEDESTVDVIIPIGVLSNPVRPETTTLKCTKDDDFWSCSDECVVEIRLGRRPGIAPGGIKPLTGDEHGLPMGSDDDWWCYVEGINLGDACADQKLKTFSGNIMTKAAVKTCETFGYMFQTISDGSTVTCNGQSMLLRAPGLFKDGLSYYMKNEGFVPCKDLSTGSLAGGTVQESLTEWCKAVEDIQKSTMAEVLSDTCLKANKGWQDQTYEWAQSFWSDKVCLGSDTLGQCYTKVYTSKLSKTIKCDKQIQLEELMRPETDFSSTNWITGIRTLVVKNPRCGFKTKATRLAVNMGILVRSSNGIIRMTKKQRPFRIYPTETGFYCKDPLLQPGETGCETDDDCQGFDGVTVRCGKKTPKRCCVSQNSKLPNDLRDKEYCCGRKSVYVHENVHHCGQ